ncbi:Phospholipase C [Staphylococcus aureus]|nr:Phospholipase C [Staphylococcus aureus]
MMVKKTKSNSLKKVATLALANLLLVGALTDNSAKAESKKDDTDLKLVSHNVYMLSTVLYPNWIHRNLVTTVFIGFGVPNGSLNYILSKILVVFLSSSLNFSSNK